MAQGCYAQRFNWRHRHVGHAFFRRFRSLLLCNEPRTGPGAASRDDRGRTFGIEQAGVNFAAFIRAAE
jgi:hypothetical protein